MSLATPPSPRPQLHPAWRWLIFGSLGCLAFGLIATIFVVTTGIFAIKSAQLSPPTPVASPIVSATPNGNAIPVAGHEGTGEVDRSDGLSTLAAKDVDPVLRNPAADPWAVIKTLRDDLVKCYGGNRSACAAYWLFSGPGLLADLSTAGHVTLTFLAIGTEIDPFNTHFTVPQLTWSGDWEFTANYLCVPDGGTLQARAQTISWDGSQSRWGTVVSRITQDNVLYPSP